MTGEAHEAIRRVQALSQRPLVDCKRALARFAGSEHAAIKHLLTRLEARQFANALIGRRAMNTLAGPPSAFEEELDRFLRLARGDVFARPVGPRHRELLKVIGLMLQDGVPKLAIRRMETVAGLPSPAELPAIARAPSAECATEPLLEDAVWIGSLPLDEDDRRCLMAL